MTSKISYFKMIKENIKHRSYLAVLSAVGMFLLLPVDILMNISRVKMLSMDPVEWAQLRFFGKINGNDNLLMLLFIILLGCMCAVSGFSYLHSKVKQDFYHSMPVTRPGWFSVSYLGGLAIFIVPYFIFTVIAVIIGRLYGLMAPGLPANCAHAFLCGVLMFLLIYHTAILAMTLTGRTGTAVLGGMVLFFYATLPVSLYESLGSAFFRTWSFQSGTFVEEHILPYVSPALLFMKAVVSDELTGGMLISLCLILAGTFAAAMLLYRKYPAESAENALAFAKSAPVIKFLTAVPGSLAITVFIINTFFGLNLFTVSFMWWLVFSILSVVIICFFIEFIYRRDIRVVALKGRVSTLLSVLSVVLLLFVFKFDVFGYDNFMPAPEKLDEMSVYTDRLSLNSFYKMTVDKKKLRTKNFEPIYELVREHTKYKPVPKAEYTPLNSEIPVTICYGMKIGVSVYRDYLADSGALIDTLDLLCEDKGYKKALLPVLSIDPSQVDDIYITDILMENTQLLLESGQRTRLMKAYLEDLSDAGLRELVYDPPVAEMNATYRFPAKAQKAKYPGSLSAMAPEPEISGLHDLLIYKSYERTLGILREYGCPVRMSLDAGEVVSVRHIKEDMDGKPTSADPDISSFPTHTDVVTDPDEIQKYLDRIELTDMKGGVCELPGATSESCEYILVLFKDGRQARYNISL